MKQPGIVTTAGAAVAVTAGMVLLLVTMPFEAGAALRPPDPAASCAEPAAGVIVISKDWQSRYPFSERFAQARSKGTGTGSHIIDLAAYRFATDALVRSDNGGRVFDAPDTSSFPLQLIRQPFADGAEDYFLVQASTPQAQVTIRKILERWPRARVLGYIPDLGYLVALNQALYERLSGRSQVHWIGLYQPAWRIAPKLDYIIAEDPDHKLGLTVLFDPARVGSAEELSELVAGTGVRLGDVTRRSHDWQVRCQGSAVAAYDLVLLPGCLWVERRAEYELHNNIARTSATTSTGRGAVAGPIMDVEDVWARGIHGEGQIAAVADTGLSTGDITTPNALHYDFGQVGSATNPMRVIACYYTWNGRGTCNDNQSIGGGHGTHTSGSVVANGIRSGSTPSTDTYPASSFAGTAPKAQLVFQSVMDSSGNLGGIPADLNNLFQQAYNDGARVHSNSWGAAVAGEYTTTSQDVDQFSWNNKDMMIVYSAGNSGRDGRTYTTACVSTGDPIDGVIDDDVIGAPGTAKNCLTIGASENYRPTFVYEYPSGDCSSSDGLEQMTWNWFNSCNFSVNPIADDLFADYAAGMGAFSSRGPTDDGRFKPDIVAPGIAIVSTRTDQNQAYEQWGVCPIPTAQRPYYMTMGGTSMSTPLTAGTATLVRQYYADGWHANGSDITNSSAVPADAFNPSSALVKATLINGAWDMNPGQFGTGAYYEIPPGWDSPHDLPNNAEGFGRVDLESSLFPGSGWGDDAARAMEVHDVSPGLQTASPNDSYPVAVASDADPLIVTLVWTDPYAASGAGTKLINNLDLIVLAPDATRYYPNRKDWTGGSTDATNNVEQVYVSAPAAGTWTIEVDAVNIPGNGQAGTTTQPYALVISGVLGTPCSTPSAPSGVTATASDTNQVTVSWSTVTADSYRIYRGTSSGGPYTLVGTDPTPPFDDTTVQGGITYYYVVRALNNPNCESADSNEATVTAYGSCSIAPTFGGLSSVTTLSDDRCGVRLEWPAASMSCGDTVVYNVYRRVDPDSMDFGNPYARCVTDLFYEDTGLTGGVTYYYVVRAEDSTGDGGGSCNSGNETTHTSETTGSVSAGSLTLYEEDFDAQADGSLAGYTVVSFGGTNDSWKGVESSCMYNSPLKSMRFGGIRLGSGCTNDYNSSTLHGVVPSESTGIYVPPGYPNTTWSFYHRYDFSADADDGGLLAADVTDDGGSFDGTYTLVPSAAISGHGYSGTPGGYNGFTGLQSTMVQTIVDLDVVCNADVSVTTGCGDRYVKLAWIGITDGNRTDDGWAFDDVQLVAGGGTACTSCPEPVQFLTATSTSGQNLIELRTPSSGSCSTVRVIRKEGSYPTSYSDGTLVGSEVACGGLDNNLQITDSGRTNTTTYFYAAFVNNGSLYSAMRTVVGRPQDTSGAVKWIFNTGATSMAPPGIGSLYGVSNDRTLHSMTAAGDASGGQWPGGWAPITMGAPSQGRMPVVSLSFAGVSKWAWISSQDGYVYGVDAGAGTAPEWSTQVGNVLQAPVSAVFTAHGEAVDRLFIGTRDAGAANKVCGLDPGTGGIVWTFDNSGSGDMGIISGSARVDYENDCIYVASRRHASGSSDTVWCLDFAGSRLWSQPHGDIDGSPSLRSNYDYGSGAEDRIYVGTVSGVVRALRASDGVERWSRDLGDGPVKYYVYADPGSDMLYISTTDTVWGVRDDDTTSTVVWSRPVPGASFPMFTPGGSHVYAGGSDGNLYQLDLGTIPPTVTTLQLGDGSAAVGAPAMRVSTPPMLYIGTESGAIYAVEIPY